MQTKGKRRFSKPAIDRAVDEAYRSIAEAVEEDPEDTAVDSHVTFRGYRGSWIEMGDGCRLRRTVHGDY